MLSSHIATEGENGWNSLSQKSPSQVKQHQCNFKYFALYSAQFWAYKSVNRLLR